MKNYWVTSRWWAAASLLMFIVCVSAEGHTTASRSGDPSELGKNTAAESPADQATLDWLEDYLRDLSAHRADEDGVGAGPELDDPAQMFAGKTKKAKKKQKSKKVPPSKKADKNKSKSTPTKTKKTK